MHPTGHKTTASAKPGANPGGLSATQGMMTARRRKPVWMAAGTNRLAAALPRLRPDKALRQTMAFAHALCRHIAILWAEDLREFVRSIGGFQQPAWPKAPHPGCGTAASPWCQVSTARTSPRSSVGRIRVKVVCQPIAVRKGYTVQAECGIPLTQLRRTLSGSFGTGLLSKSVPTDYTNYSARLGPDHRVRAAYGNGLDSSDCH